MKKVEEAVFVFKEIEKRVEKFTIELIFIKELFEFVYVVYLEVEDYRIGVVMVRD